MQKCVMIMRVKQANPPQLTFVVSAVPEAESACLRY